MFFFKNPAAQEFIWFYCFCKYIFFILLNLSAEIIYNLTVFLYHNKLANIIYHSQNSSEA
jgi:hypothetical protein